MGCFNQHAGRVARTGQLPVRTDPPRVAEQPVPAREALAAAVTAVGVDARLAAPAAFDYGVKLARRRGWRVESDPREACEHHAQLSISSIVGMTVFGVLAGRQSEMTRPHCRQTNWRHVGEMMQPVMVEARRVLLDYQSDRVEHRSRVDVQHMVRLGRARAPECADDIR